MTDYSYAEEFELVWGACIYALVELKLPIVALDKEAGTVQASWSDAPYAERSTYCNCGFSLVHEVARHGKLQLTVTPNGDSYTVHILTEFANTTKSGLIVVEGHGCKSTGKLETKINAIILDALAKHHANAA